MKTTDITIREHLKKMHLKRAQEFQDYINGKPFIGDTEKNMLERLRDNRLTLASNIH